MTTKRFRGKVKFWDGDMIRLGEREFGKLSEHAGTRILPGFRFWWFKRLMFLLRRLWSKQ